MLSEVSQDRARQIPYDFTHMWNIKNKINKINEQTKQTERTEQSLPEGKRKEGRKGEGD